MLAGTNHDHSAGIRPGLHGHNLGTAYGVNSDGNNYEVVPENGTATDLAGLVIKQSFWIWPDRNIAGNAIDYFVKVEGMTFNQAMQIITAAAPCDASGSESRQTTERARHNPGNPTTAAWQQLR